MNRKWKFWCGNLHNEASGLQLCWCLGAALNAWTLLQRGTTFLPSGGLWWDQSYYWFLFMENPSGCINLSYILMIPVSSEECCRSPSLLHSAPPSLYLSTHECKSQGTKQNLTPMSIVMSSPSSHQQFGFFYHLLTNKVRWDLVLNRICYVALLLQIQRSLGLNEPRLSASV